MAQAGRVWAAMRDLADSYPPHGRCCATRSNLGRGSGRVKALLWLAGGAAVAERPGRGGRASTPPTPPSSWTAWRNGAWWNAGRTPPTGAASWSSLTPAGKEAIGRVERIQREPPAGFADLSPAELDTLEDLVTRITARSEPAS